MKTYSEFLEQQNYSRTTIRGYVKQAQGFEKWCKRNSTTPNEIDYKKCLKYIQYLTRKGTTKKTVNHRLLSVKIYFDYLIDEACRVDNPIENTTIKGVKRNTTYNLLSADELEDLYYSFESGNATDNYSLLCAKRNKVITGLMVYQGLNTTDLGNLKIEHLQLNKGKIYVPSAKRSNAKELELKPWQVMELMEYQMQVLPLLEKRVSNEKNKLFPLNGRFGIIVGRLVKKLKAINAKVHNIHQIRASVITVWLGQYNLRKVQYLAGHRYISSTERYLQDDLENLHEIVNNFHPIS